MHVHRLPNKEIIQGIVPIKTIFPCSCIIFCVRPCTRKKIFPFGTCQYKFTFSERERWNEPATATPHKPNVAYFSEMLIGLSRTYNDVAANMRKLSTVLNNDIKYNDEIKSEKQRRIIQNNFDSLRYAAPLCVNLSKLKIPLNNVNAEIQLA